MNATAEDIKRAEFEALTILRKRFKLRDAGAGKYDAFCPAHDDRGGKSLRVYRCEDGKLRFRCYAGCNFNDVRSALGLPEWRGSIPASRHMPPRRHEPKDTRYNFAQLAEYFHQGVGILFDSLAMELGVSVQSLIDSGAGRASGYAMYSAKRGTEVNIHAWSFPMVDASLAVTGLRMRADRHDDRSVKFSWTDSTPGLFIGERWMGEGPIIVCEGPSERCAFYDWGYDAIGLPSCNDGFDLLLDLLKSRILPLNPKRHIAILANGDEAKIQPGSGNKFYPGQDGSKALATLLAPKVYPAEVRVLVSPPPEKDFRAWHHKGTTRRQIDAWIKSQKRYRP